MTVMTETQMLLAVTIFCRKYKGTCLLNVPNISQDTLDVIVPNECNVCVIREKYMIRFNTHCELCIFWVETAQQNVLRFNRMNYQEPVEKVEYDNFNEFLKTFDLSLEDTV